MEMPECPVCLQVFNNEDTVPRVLACGHSTCQACLPQLIQLFPNTIRCPSCNQLVHYPHNQGPSALPKNIDLLSFINQQNPNPSSNSSHKGSSRKSEFLPGLWSEELYSNWKEWVLPEEAVSIEGSGKDRIFLMNGRVGSNLGRFCSREGKSVSLLLVVSSNVKDSLFDFSYDVRIMEALRQLGERERDELSLILRACSRQVRVCRGYGLWMDSGDGSVFLVCENLNGNMDKKLMDLRNVDGDGLLEGAEQNSILNLRMPGFLMVGMELCEALLGFHSEGLVSGCLGFSCFSFDEFGRIFVDPNEVLVIGRKVRKCVASTVVAGFQKDGRLETETTIKDILEIRTFVSPEVLLELLCNEGIASTSSSLSCSVMYSSDVWSLVCILVSLVGGSFVEELFNDLYNLLSEVHEENFAERYMNWVERVSSTMENVWGMEFVTMHKMVCSCLEFDPGSRPHVADVWRCIRGLLIKPHVDILVGVDEIISTGDTAHCIILGNLCHMADESEKESQRSKGLDLLASGKVGDVKVERDLMEGLPLGKFQSVNLEGHLDCITGLAVGGGFLFSSSFDKTVHIWSLQDFSHIQSLKGHEHKVMAVTFVDSNDPLCVSADSEGGIFIWSIGISSEREPLKKWYEPKDWRYSGIHALAVSGAEHIYTGSGDKSIKAWSLQDCTLTCTMTGHKSVVSSLEVSNGVLYSGSWDGSIRLWSLHNHSPLAALVDETPENVTSVLSLSVCDNILVAAYENGCIKIWRDDVLSRSIEIGNGAILAVDVAGKWLFTGGWDKKVNVQALSGDELQVDMRPVGSIACNSVITSLLYWEGKLFAGFADRSIKVYYSS